MAKIYVAGPMRGYPELNFPAFHKAATDLELGMWDVVNPAVINPDPNADYYDCMRADIKALCDCHAIYLLRGWEHSEGANVEFQVARALQLQIIFQSNGNFTNTNE